MALCSACLLPLFACGRDADRLDPPSPSETAASLDALRGHLVGFQGVKLQPPRGADGGAGGGGASGQFLFQPAGSVLEWFLFADGLADGRAYQLELNVDDSLSYAIASVRADSAGRLRAHGALAEFSDRGCRTTNVVAPPRPLVGVHALNVRVKDDGSPGGKLLDQALTSPSASTAACVGNGDGSFAYRLFAEHPVQFRGDGSSPIR